MTENLVYFSTEVVTQFFHTLFTLLIVVQQNDPLIYRVVFVAPSGSDGLLLVFLSAEIAPPQEHVCSVLAHWNTNQVQPGLLRAF